MSTLSPKLNEAEKQELQRLEIIVGQGLRAFHAAGLALREIRDRRLYRASYPTFEEYVEQRWQISRPRAYQLIGSAQVMDDLSTKLDTAQPLPTRDSQARALADLTPEERHTAWAEVLEDHPEGDATTGEVAEAAQRVRDYSSRITPEVAEIAQRAFSRLSPEQKTQLVEESREKVQRQLKAVVPSSASKRRDKAEWHVRQAQRHYEALGGDEAGEVLGHLEQALLASAELLV